MAWEIKNGRQFEVSDSQPEPVGARGVFETVRVSAGEPACWAEHILRFREGCAAFALRSAPDGNQLWDGAKALMSANHIRDGVLRWSAWITAEGKEGWNLRVGPCRPSSLKAAWGVVIAPRRLPALGPEAVYKHLGRTAWREAWAAAQAAGRDEALLADEQERIVEGTISNVFGVCGGVLITPSLACRPLPGVTRGQVLALAREQGLTVEEGVLSVEQIRAADEIFVTNSLIGLRPVAVIDSRSLGTPGPITMRLQTAWNWKYGSGGD